MFTVKSPNAFVPVSVKIQDLLNFCLKIKNLPRTIKDILANTIFLFLTLIIPFEPFNLCRSIAPYLVWDCPPLQLVLGGLFLQQVLVLVLRHFHASVPPPQASSPLASVPMSSRRVMTLMTLRMQSWIWSWNERLRSRRSGGRRSSVHSASLPRSPCPVAGGVSSMGHASHPSGCLADRSG